VVILVLTGDVLRRHRSIAERARAGGYSCAVTGAAAPAGGSPRARFQTRSRITASPATTTIATNVSGSLRTVSTAKNASTTSVTTTPTRMSHACAPVSRRNRYPATPMRTKIASEHALPTEAIAERSTVLATTSTTAALIRTPLFAPSREAGPKNGGNWPTPDSIRVRPAEAYSVATTDPAMPTMAAIAIIVKPASPSAGRPASAIAVGPYCTTSSTVNVPNTLIATSTYTIVVTPSARFIAFGKSRAGSLMSPTANVIT